MIWVDMPLETVANCATTRQLLVPNRADDNEVNIGASYCAIV